VAHFIKPLISRVAAWKQFHVNRGFNKTCQKKRPAADRKKERVCLLALFISAVPLSTLISATTNTKKENRI
jgi:hypothetical protein